MTVLGNDSFTRSDLASGWGVATDGQIWTQTGPGTRFLSGNEGVLVSTGGDQHVQLGTQTSGDMDLLCRFSVNNLNDIVGLQGRFTSSGGNTTCYKLLFYSGGIHINKAIAGANSNLSNYNQAITANTYYWLRFWISGSNLYGKIWQDGTAELGYWMISATDTSVTGSGGVALLGTTDAASSGVRFDHFYAVDVVHNNQLSTFSAEVSVSGGVTVIEQVPTFGTTMAQAGTMTISERLTTFSAEAQILNINLQTSPISLSGVRGPTTLQAARGTVTCSATRGTITFTAI